MALDFDTDFNMKRIGTHKTSRVASGKVIPSNVSLVQFLLLNDVRSEVCIRMTLLVV